MNKTLRTFYSVLLVAFFSFGFFFAGGLTANAGCEGSHCSLLQRWEGYQDQSFEFVFNLLVTVTSDVTVESPQSVDPAKVITPNTFDCEQGGKFNVPISATGEVTGWMSSWYDSPPVDFLANGVWNGSTDGLACYHGQYSQVALGYNQENAENLADPTNPELCSYKPITATWSDIWTTDTAGVTCQTVGPRLGECTVPNLDEKTINLTLRRNVNNFRWGDVRNVGLFGTVGLYKMSMVSSTEIQCADNNVPHLIAKDISHSPNPAKATDSISFNGKIKNVGGASSDSFTPVLSVDENADGSWDVTAPAAAMPALAANAEETVNWPSAWTAVAGTHRFKICPNASSDPADCAVETFQVEEGPDDPITPVNPPAPIIPTVSLTIDGVSGTVSVVRGSNKNLVWTVQNADTCTATGNWQGDRSTAGDTVPTGAITAARTYNLTCTSTTNDSATATLRVNVRDSITGQDIRDL